MIGIGDGCALGIEDGCALGKTDGCALGKTDGCRQCSPVLLLAGRPPAKHFTINVTSETIKKSWGMNPLKNLCHDAKKLKVREDAASKDV